MLDILQRGGVEIHEANAPFTADGVEYPAETYLVLMSQPFRAHAKDLLEVQRYPERRPSPESPPERPYDIAGWTLPLQMGVRTIAVVHPFEADLSRVPVLAQAAGRLARVPEPTGYLFENRTNLEAIVLNRLLNAKLADNSPRYTLYRADQEIESGGKTFSRGSILIKTAAPPLQEVEEMAALASEFGIDIYADEFTDDKYPVVRSQKWLHRAWVSTSRGQRTWTKDGPAGF